MDSLIDRCRALALRSEVGADDLRFAMAAALPSDDELAGYLRPSSTHAYGRFPYLRGPRVEAMIATWSRAFACAPHDHGGSIGAVRVVRGRALHRRYTLIGGDLRMVDESRFAEGDVMDVESADIHAMIDDGAEAPLVTAHVYTTPIRQMLVYDVAVCRTLIVGDDCGAWVPVAQPALVVRVVEGFVPRSQLLAEAL